MNKEFSILSLMVKDHKKIEKLLDDLEEKSNDDFESMLKAFYKFEWQLEKHIFTEEKAIFTKYNPEDIEEGYKMLPEITKQHNIIVNTLDKWRKNVRNRKTINDVYDFKEFLREHRIYEEKNVYPKLEESLSDEDKRHIVAKIDEII